MAVRPRFDPKRPLVAARDFTFMGKEYAPGDPFGPFDAALVPDRLRARQYEARAVNFGDDAETEAEANPIQMTGPKGGRYTITAPWLDEPEVVRGKVNAEKRLAELKAEGAPLGFIEGGSAVTVEGGEGGWYEVNAPWLDEPEKVQGREAAEARQRELHDAGEPDTYKGVTLTAGENGWYALTREGVDVELKVQGEDNARAAAAKLRAGEMIEGQPAEWNSPDPAKAGGVVENSGENQTEKPGMIDENKDKPTDGDKPNEPGTNQPNGAEVINDKARAEEAGKDGEGDGTTATVGP